MTPNVNLFRAEFERAAATRGFKSTILDKLTIYRVETKTLLAVQTDTTRDQYVWFRQGDLDAGLDASLDGLKREYGFNKSGRDVRPKHGQHADLKASFHEEPLVRIKLKVLSDAQQIVDGLRT